MIVNLLLAIMRNYIATQSSITLQQLTTHFKKSAAAARVNKVQCLTRAQVIILKLYTKGGAQISGKRTGLSIYGGVGGPLTPSHSNKLALGMRC